MKRYTHLRKSEIAGFGTPEESNKRVKFLLDQEAKGINTVFDYPILRGYDSDDPVAIADFKSCQSLYNDKRDY